MSIQITLDKMNEMKLFGMVRALTTLIEAAQRPDLSSDELVAHLVDAEWENRQTSRVNRLIRYAHFRYGASLEQMNFRVQRNLDRGRLTRFADCEWIRRRQNIIITGPTGVGKSFIACALGHQACMYGLRTLYFNAGKLFGDLKVRRADGTYGREIKRIGRQDVLILDDFGLEKLDQPSRMSLLEILEDRHGVRSTIFTSQHPVKNWHTIIADASIADAVCDRIMHSAHRFQLDGDSLREKFAEKLD